MAAPITTTYSEEARRQIIEHVLTELCIGRPVSKILEDDFMPSSKTWYRWLLDDEELEQKVERARERGAAYLVDEIVDIADDASTDVYIEYDKNGRPYAKTDGDVIQRAKLRVYAREKVAAMIAPRRYGPKVDVTSGGEALPAGNATPAKIEALVTLGVQRVLESRQMKQLPQGEDDGDN